MEWEWFAPGAGTAAVGTAAWVTANAAAATHQAQRKYDYTGVQETTFVRLLREGRLDRFVPNLAYPIRAWWRPQEAARLRRSITRYVGIAFFHDGSNVTQTFAFQERRRSPLEVFESVRTVMAIDDDFDGAAFSGDAARFSGDGYEVFIWSIRYVPKRRL